MAILDYTPNTTTEPIFTVLYFLLHAHRQSLTFRPVTLGSPGPSFCRTSNLVSTQDNEDLISFLTAHLAMFLPLFQSLTHSGP